MIVSIGKTLTNHIIKYYNSHVLGKFKFKLHIIDSSIKNKIQCCRRFTKGL